LGGPQAGFIVGRNDLIARIKNNPMKRALRIDKVRLAALEATLRLYRDPDRVAERLPTLRLLARPKKEIEGAARRLLPVVAAKIGDGFDVAIAACASQIGSGALPMETVPSAGLAMRPRAVKRGGRLLSMLSMALRRLPVPVVGRIENGALILDLRCLDDEAAFIANLAALDVAEPKP
jgi:L-seryl-tRNA(Ser) seleniumtransferase